MSKYLDNNGLLYFWQKLKTALGTKVDAVAGKGLSANDYTTAEKTKLAGIAAGANAYAHPSGDGNRHVPATGAGNNGKFLRAGSTAASEAWGTLAKADVTGALGYAPPTPAEVGAKASLADYIVTLMAENWAGTGPYTQTAGAAGMLGTDVALVDIVLDDDMDAATEELIDYRCIHRIDSQNGAVLATCFGDKPVVDLTLRCRVVR